VFDCAQDNSKLTTAMKLHVGIDIVFH